MGHVGKTQKAGTRVVSGPVGWFLRVLRKSESHIKVHSVPVHPIMVVPKHLQRKQQHHLAPTAALKPHEESSLNAALLGFGLRNR